MSYDMERFYERKFQSRALIVFITGFMVGGLLVWAFSGPSVPPKPTAKEIAVDACVEKGGIPITDQYNRLTDCKKYDD